MPEVDLEALEKEAQSEQSKVEAHTIVSKFVGKKEIFKGPELETWFDNRDEALVKNQQARRQKEYQSLGLNEFGQTKEEEEKSKEISELVLEKNKLLEKVDEIDLRILEVNSRKPEKK